MKWIEATNGWLYDAYVRTKHNPHKQILVQLTPFPSRARVCEARIIDTNGVLGFQVLNRPNHWSIVGMLDVTHWMPMPEPMKEGEHETTQGGTSV